MLIYLQALESPLYQTDFELLHEHYKGLLYHVAYEILKNVDDAEDAVSEAFWVIAKNMSKLSPPISSKTRTYIVLVVESTSIDLWRKRQRQVSTVPLEEPHLSIPYSGGNRVTELTLCLAAHDRELLLLRFEQGYSLREAAQLLGITESAARKREQRAKRRLEELCKQEGLL